MVRCKAPHSENILAVATSGRGVKRAPSSGYPDFLPPGDVASVCALSFDKFNRSCVAYI